jgi:Trk-type K+ transport system membrane component
LPSGKVNRISQVSEKRLEVLPLDATTERPGVVSLLIWAGCLYLLILPLADVLIRLKWPAGAELSWVRGRFTAVNALTLTGFSQIIPLAKFPEPAKWTIFVLTAIGAMFPMILGGMAVVRILKLPYSDSQIALSSFTLFFVLVAAGSIPLIASNYGAANSFMLSASALANSGMHFGAVPGAMNWQTHLVLLPLAILGGLGSPVLIELVALLRMKGGLCKYSKTVLATTAWVYLVLFGLIAAMQLVESESFAGKWLKIFGSSSALSIDSRTAGLPIDGAQVADVPRSAQWLLLLPMMLGGWAAGTAGGIKINTFVGLFRGITQGLRGGSIGRPVAIAAVWIGIYLGLAMLFFLMMLWSEPDLPADRLLFMTISALSNVGLSHDPVSMTGSGLDVLASAMLLGRLMPLGMLWWMAMTTREAEMPVG